MIRKLKKHMNMSDFELKGNAYYRLSKKTTKTINNKNITNDLAIEFLTIDPSRIRLFEKYPENWEELLSDEPIKEESAPEEEHIDSYEEQLKRSELYNTKLKDLKKLYPKIKFSVGMSKDDFITEILKLEK
jgi:hypothetical protein